MNARVCHGLSACLVWAALAPSLLRAQEAVPDFAREVRPLLTRYCFKCHGPDEKTRKARLRLDTAGKAAAGVIVPGAPEQSELLARIFAKDPEKRMPPPATKTELNAEQKGVFQRWIASGAKYEQHWAFVPPRSMPSPNVVNATWPKNAIDHFVLARLEAEGLAPSPEAGRRSRARLR